MNAEQFYHICRSAASIAGVREISVFGSSAVIPWLEHQRPDAPWWASLELDLDPGGQALADIVDGCIGELSPFHDSFGVYAHGLTLDAFTSPPDWPVRAGIFIEPASGIRIRAPHPLDLTVSKVARGDDRDWAFALFCRDAFQLSRDAITAGLRAIGEARPEYAIAVARAIELLPSRL